LNELPIEITLPPLSIADEGPECGNSHLLKGKDLSGGGQSRAVSADEQIETLRAILKHEQEEARASRSQSFYMRDLAVMVPGVQGVQCKVEDGLKDSTEQCPSGQQTEQGEVSGMLYKVKITVSDSIRHEYHDP
jgi:hypothetical protein